MGVRGIIANSMTFAVAVQTARGKQLRVRVMLDLQERLIFLPSGIIPDVVDQLDKFVEQLSEIAASQLAYLKWDGTSDPLTEYRPLRILPGYVINRSEVRFNVLLDEGALLPVAELDGRSRIELGA